MSWSPIEHTIIRDAVQCQAVHDVGYTVMGNIGCDNVTLLRELYERLHGFDAPGGGMFYSLYSKDISYRQAVHQGVAEVLTPVCDRLFSAYRTVINSFIVKLPGQQSSFTLHQDSSGLDETRYSPLSLWIPMQDTDLSNGTLCVVPKTHGLYHSLRGISFATPYADYEAVLRRYLMPITLRAGDILAFDNRLVHYSHTNLTGVPRIVVMCGLFPLEAGIEVCYKDNSRLGSPIEIYAQTEDFLITNEAFYENCTARPYRGEKVREVNGNLPPRSVYDFLSWAHRMGLQRTDIPELMGGDAVMHIVSEPTGG